MPPHQLHPVTPSRPTYGCIMQEVVEALTVTYVASHPNSAVVQQRLWPLNRDLVLRAMVALYQKDATNISRVLDVSQVCLPYCSGQLMFSSLLALCAASHTSFPLHGSWGALLAPSCSPAALPAALLRPAALRVICNRQGSRLWGGKRIMSSLRCSWHRTPSPSRSLMT